MNGPPERLALRHVEDNRAGGGSQLPSSNFGMGNHGRLSILQDRIKVELRKKADVLGNKLFSPESAALREAPASLRMDPGRGKPRGDGQRT